MRERIDPFEQMDRMLEQMRRNLWTAPDATQFSARRPALSDAGSGIEAVGESHSDHALTVDRTDDAFVVLADLPGFEKEEIELTFDDGMLTITGVHEVTDDHSARSRTVHESVRVPGDVLVDDITASYQNGVLEVTLPAEEEESADDHRIDIE